MVVARFHLFLTGSHLVVSASTIWVTWTRGVGDDVGQVDSPCPPQSEDGQLYGGGGGVPASFQVFLILPVPGVELRY